jgi:arylsulfatase A-like enzyme
MPFPRCKANLYDTGTRVALAIRWGANVKPGRTVSDFVNLSDLAPTFLEAAGVKIPPVMTARSLMPVLTAPGNDRIDPSRDHVIFGRERHCVAQEAPQTGGYPARALRTDDYLYIRNLDADRWPAGTPDHTLASRGEAWLADCDNGPAKHYMWVHRNDPAVKPLYELCFAKRPAEELYDLKKDPDQLHNIAAEPARAAVKKQLADQLTEYLRRTQDPRLTGGGEKLDNYPYYGGIPSWPGDKAFEKY